MRLIPIATFAFMLTLAASASAAYVPGMNCIEVGGFAQQVVEQKAVGVGLDEALDGLQNSLGPEYANTKRALAQIIRGIYTDKTLSAGSPEAVGKAYERTCKLVEGAE